ncbi:MAG TPA: dethiobiotin synthase [Chitinophagaceae bacterium]|nr:dethiobiotin synthase [Chitinophagaceae bacterium]
MRPIFITGIGTGIGKTVISAIVTEALQADYWKPVQAGITDGTDAAWIKQMLNSKISVILPETYRLEMPASPHIAARAEQKNIDLAKIRAHYSLIHDPEKYLVVEGAGGLMVPLNDQEFVLDLIKLLNAKVILVSRNYLGSINHSLLTASACRAHDLDVAGWIFNDQYLNYEEEIVKWSGYPRLASIPLAEKLDRNFIVQQAAAIRPALNKLV